MDFSLYITIFFAVLFGYAVLVGFIRGLKKSIYWLIVMIIYFGLFFLTLDIVVKAIYTVNIPKLGDILGSFNQELSGVTTIKTALETYIKSQVPDEYASILARDHVKDLINSVGLFVLKIAYTVLYFFIFKIIYKFICWIIRLIVVRVDKGDPKRRFWGAFIGAIRGALTIYLFFIFFGGLINIGENVYKILPEESKIAEVDGFLDAYNNHFIVKIMNFVPSTEKDTPMHYYLFDSIFTINIEYEVKPTPPETQALLFLSNGYHPPFKIINTNAQQPVKVDAKIAFRKEIALFISIYEYYINSDYYHSDNELNKITSDDIRTIIEYISESDLINTLLPIAIDVGLEYFKYEIEIPRDELYRINWKQEFLILGDLAATTFDLINTAGLLDPEQEVETIPFTGDEVKEIFEGLAESDLVTLAAYVAIEPILTLLGENVQAIITVPKDINWKNEFRVIGSIVAAIIDTEITVSEIKNPEPTLLIKRLAKLDLTIILDSKIIKNALINIFSGKAKIEGLDQIVVPDEIDWEVELVNILTAVNAIAPLVENIDFNNLSLKVLSEFEDDVIDKIFSSRILVATVSKFISETDFGDAPIIISDTVYDETGYINKNELTNVVNAFRVLIDKLPCDKQGDDQVCQDLGFNYKAILTLSDKDIEVILSSTIITETIGNLLIEQVGDMLIIPESVKESITIKDEERIVISKEELEKLFKNIIIFNFTDYEDINFDETLLDKLTIVDDNGKKVFDPNKRQVLFGDKSSVIIQASLSKMILDLTTNEDSMIIVPYYSYNNELIREMRENGLELIAKMELERVLNALIVIGIEDYNNIDNIKIETLKDNINTILESAILHATISNQVIRQDSEDIIIPYSVRQNRGVTGKETIYVDNQEIEAIVKTLFNLGVTQFDEFTGEINLANLYDSEKRETALSSDIIHATISKQIINLKDSQGSDSSDIVIPDSLITTKEEPGRTIKLVSRDEIDAIFQAFEALGFETVDEFDGSFQLDTIAGNLLKQEQILNSVIIHATVSKQILKLHEDGNIVVPDIDENNKKIVELDENDNIKYVAKDEISAVIDALYILNFTGVDYDNEKVNLNNLTDAINLYDNKSDKERVLESSIIRATISRELINLHEQGNIVVPKENYNEEEIIKDKGEFKFIAYNELLALIDALDVINIENISTYDGSVNLSNLTGDNRDNQDVILGSAILHATISKQILDLDNNDDIIVPSKDANNESIIKLVEGVNYVVDTEIKSIIDALDVLGKNDVTTFDGQVSLKNLYSNPEKQETLLKSAVIHATISKQLLDISNNSDNDLKVPEYHYVLVGDDEVENIRIINNVDGIQYVDKDEIKALIDVLELLGKKDINDFEGNVTLTQFYNDEQKQDKLLRSATVHYTISYQILTNGFLNVPQTYIGNKPIQRTIQGKLYVDTEEIKALINAMELLNITDITSLDADITLQQFINNRNILDSMIIHATISNELLNNEDLIVPNTVRTDSYDGFIYVYRDEIEYILDALNLAGITDFDSIELNPTNVFNNNFEDMLKSASIHATLSREILDYAKDENDTTFEMGDLIIPTFYREDVNVGLLTHSQIEKTELIDLLNALKALNFNSFSDNINDSYITTDIESSTIRNSILASASLHVTIDRMMNTSDYIVEHTPSKAQETAYGITVITKDEITNFIMAAKVVGEQSFLNVTFDLETLQDLYSADRDAVETILESMIVRNAITNELRPTPLFGFFNAEDFEDNDPNSFLTKVAILELLY